MVPRRPPRCPKCRGTYVRLWLPGPSVEVLVDVARPQEGVLAALVHADDPAPSARPMLVLCAVCEADFGHRPRQHGRPAYAVAVEAAEEGPWPAARDWQVSDLNTDFFSTALQQLIDAYDEELTGEPQYRYGPSPSTPDPPGRGALEAGQHVDHLPTGDDPGAGGQGVDHPPGVEEAVATGDWKSTSMVEKYAKAGLRRAGKDDRGRTQAALDALVVPLPPPT